MFHPLLINDRAESGCTTEAAIERIAVVNKKVPKVAHRCLSYRLAAEAKAQRSCKPTLSRISMLKFALHSQNICLFILSYNKMCIMYYKALPLRLETLA